MLKKVIEYIDFNGETRKEEFYFNINKAEVMELQLGTAGGFTEKIKSAIDRKDVPEIVSIFKSLILKSYGVKSADGKRFLKSPELSAEFEQSGAYEELFMELVKNSKAAEDFIRAIMPVVEDNDKKKLEAPKQPEIIEKN